MTSTLCDYDEDTQLCFIGFRKIMIFCLPFTYRYKWANVMKMLGSIKIGVYTYLTNWQLMKDKLCIGIANMSKQYEETFQGKN